MADGTEKRIFFNGHIQADRSSGIQWMATRSAVMLNPASVVSVIGLFKKSKKSDDE